MSQQSNHCLGLVLWYILLPVRYIILPVRNKRRAVFGLMITALLVQMFYTHSRPQSALSARISGDIVIITPSNSKSEDGVLQDQQASVAVDNGNLYGNDSVVKHHNVDYIISTPHLCNASSLLALIFVQSGTDGVEYRNLIRNTWGGIHEYGGHQIRTVFVIALPGPDASFTQDDILLESRLHLDMIQGNFIDHYRNLTYKHLMALHWVHTHCAQAKYIVKADDDTIINIFRLIRLLSHPDFTLSSAIYCSIYRHMKPRRDKGDKWYVTQDEYPGEMYPPYCEGFAYIMAPVLAPQLFNASHTTKYYWIDDVYVTGLLMEKIGARHIGFKDPFGYTTLSETSNDFGEPDKVLFLLLKYFRNTKKLTCWTRVWENIISQENSTTHHNLHLSARFVSHIH